MNTSKHNSILQLDEKFQALPVGIRAFCYYSLVGIDDFPITLTLPRLYEAYRITNIISERCHTAGELEKCGRFEEAILLYEKNVADCTYEKTSYERLIEIFINSGQIEKAIIVCRRFVGVIDTICKVATASSELISNKIEMEARLDELLQLAGHDKTSSFHSNPNDK